MLTPAQKIAIIFGLLAIVMIVLYAVHRFTKKAESDPLVQDMHENLRGTLDDEKVKQLLREYWQLVDTRTSGGFLTFAQSERITEVYEQLRRVYPYPQRIPRPQP